MDTFIPKEKLTAYERWELAAFDEAERETRAMPSAGAAAAPAAEAVPQPPDPAEIERQIQQVLVEAREAGYAEGYQAGLAAGEAAGRAAGEAALAELAAQLAALGNGFAEALRARESELADEVLALALTVARQVIRAQVRHHPEGLIDVVREAILALPSQHGHPTLHVHPADAPLVREQLTDVLAHTGWRIVEDPTLEAGGCRIDNGASEVDATLANRWKRVVEAIGTRVDWHDETP